MSSDHPKQLIVEAHDDVGAVTGVMRHYVKWERPDFVHDKYKWAVHQEPRNSADEVLDRAYLSTMLKSPQIKRLGIMLDADENFKGRWESLKDVAKKRFTVVPDKLPEGGLILTDNDDGVKFGVWIMPDNKSVGMLEDFCAKLVPSACKPHWDHAETSYKGARPLGATWKDVHATKAPLHTWLAWQDPPGERLGIAITKNILNPASDKAKPFVDWMLSLYELEAK